MSCASILSLKLCCDSDLLRLGFLASIRTSSIGEIILILSYSRSIDPMEEKSVHS